MSKNIIMRIIWYWVVEGKQQIIAAGYLLSVLLEISFDGERHLNKN